MIAILFVLLGTSGQHSVHNLIFDHHWVDAEDEVGVVAMVECIHDYAVPFPLVAESGMDVNARNTKACNL